MRDREGNLVSVQAMVANTARLKAANDALEAAVCRDVPEAKLDQLIQAVNRQAELNDRLAKTLGVLQVGDTQLSAVVPAGEAPVIQNGERAVVRFSTATGDADAREAAQRMFGRLVTRELLKHRTPAELKRTVHVLSYGAQS